MKNNKYVKLGLVLGLGVTFLSPALAANVGALAANISSQTNDLGELLASVSYLAGIGFGIKAALKLKESNENKGQTPLSQPITLGVVSALLFALPSTLTTATETVFNDTGGNLGTVQRGS